ncbi:MAG: pantoate--beta-alanine ligase [Bacteroidota bacterium]
MFIFRRAAELQAFLQRRRTHGRSLGFVPTMGALHSGHLSLIEQSQKENELTVASIFVNPTQFNEAEDLNTYPRTPGRDCELLAQVGCGLVFLPTVEEVYPPDLEQDLSFDFDGLDERLEGAHRPGHFNGVAQVVTRLLELVQPDRLYLGQKDAQQVAILRKTVEQLGGGIEIVAVPTVRDSDGLALSSRNARLSEQARKDAPNIYQALLRTSAGLLDGGQVDTLLASAIADINAFTTLNVEYLELVDAKQMKPIEEFHDAQQAILVAAVWAEDVRLIDNLPVG